MEGREQHAICGFIKLLFTSLTSQGQLVGGLLAWHTELEYARINRQNKEEVKLPPLEHNGNTFLPTALSGFLEQTKQEGTFPLCPHPLVQEKNDVKYTTVKVI